MNMWRGFGFAARLIPSLTVLTFLGCQRGPGLVDTLGTAIEDVSLCRRCDPRALAPFIVVASVEENQIVAKHVEAARYPGVYLDLHAVRCKRENSLKGWADWTRAEILLLRGRQVHRFFA